MVRGVCDPYIRWLAPWRMADGNRGWGIYSIHRFIQLVD